MTTSTVITTVPTEEPNKIGRERTEDLFSMFEGNVHYLSSCLKLSYFHGLEKLKFLQIR